MNENMKQNGQQQPTTPTPEVSGDQGGARTFTQEDVNRIVSERLARDRADRATAPSPADEREQALKAHEARMDCRDYLDSKKYPAALLDVLDTSDVDKFKEAADLLIEKFPAIVGDTLPAAPVPQIVMPTGRGAAPDPIAAAFKPKIDFLGVI